MASIDPTPFDSESIFTLSTHPDLTMAKVESGNWVLKAAEREQAREAGQEGNICVIEGGKPRLHPSKTFLRGLSIIRIILAHLAV